MYAFDLLRYYFCTRSQLAKFIPDDCGKENPILTHDTIAISSQMMSMKVTVDIICVFDRQLLNEVIRLCIRVPKTLTKSSESFSTKVVE